MPPLVVNERVAVGDQILKIAYLRSVDGGKVDLVHDSRGQCKPEPTRSRIGGADCVFVTARPPRFNAGLAKRFAIVRLRLHTSHLSFVFIRQNLRARTACKAQLNAWMWPESPQAFSCLLAIVAR